MTTLEEASARKVDAELWWTSHALFFKVLDDCVAGGAARRSWLENDAAAARVVVESSSEHDYWQHQEESDRGAVLAENVRANHNWLLKTLAQFKPPSVSSRAALDSSSVAVGSHLLKITQNLKDLALQVSSLLELDEIQTYILTTRVCESYSSLSDNDAVVSAIAVAYYMERLSILNATRLLLTCHVAEESTTAPRLLQALSDEVMTLVEDGLEEKILSVLKESLSAVQLKHLDREFTDLWAEQAALEQTLLLDIIFLLYYKPLCVCKFTQLKDLMTIFEGLIIWRSKGEMLALTAEAEKSLMHARRQAVLIIIEALDFECLLLMMQNDVPFSQGGHSLSVDNVRQLDIKMAGLECEGVTEYGPLILSWATFLYLMSFLPLSEGQAALVEGAHAVYMRQAYEAGAYKYLLDMLRDEFFQEFDAQLGGYKCVIKTLISAFLAAYDSVGRMDLDGHDSIVDVLCEIYRGQEALCLELWDRDSSIDGPIRNLLCSLRESFPYRTVSLVRLLATQCEGTWPAECVYDFLNEMVDITCLYQCDEQSLMNETRSMVRTTITLHVPDAPGMLIPAGTPGHILKEFSGGVCLVRWECKHNVMIVLLLRMLQRSVNGFHMEEVLAIVDLFNCMLSSNKTLTHFLLDLDLSGATATVSGDGCMESFLRLDFLGMICFVINASIQNTGKTVTIASCIGILTSCSFCCPVEVMTKLGQSLLFKHSGSYLSSLDGRAFAGGSQLHELIVNSEQTIGHYPVTIAVLDFTKTMVERGDWKPADCFSLTSLVMHVIGDAFVNHGNWKYQQRCERWIITTKIIWIMRSIVLGIIQTTEISSLQGVLELLLYDCAVHDVLLKVLSVSAQELEELHLNRAVGVKEIQWLHEAIYSVLMLLHDLVADVTSGVCSKEYNGGKLLDQTLFRKASGSLPVVSAIVSFISSSRNQDLQFASAKALTTLFLLAQRSRQHPNSIASLISSREQKRVMQSAIGDLLSVNTALSNSPVFEAVIDLLTAAVRWQPGLVDHFLLPIEKPRTSTTMSEQGVGPPIRENGSTPPTTVRATEGVDALWRLVSNFQMLSKSHPRELSRVLFLLASLWEGGVEHLHIIEALRSKAGFWKELTSCLSFCNSSNTLYPTVLSEVKAARHPEKQVASSKRNIELVAYAFRYTCEASVLSIMARDIFLQQHLLSAGSLESGRGATENGARNMNTFSQVPRTSIESGALQLVLDWCNRLQMSSITSSYSNCLYDLEVVSQAKAEAELLLVGLMGKILSGDMRGLKASFAGRIREAVIQIGQHPAFKDLSEQYSACAYGYGEQLQLMLVSDLFHHLQGELDGGRPMPSGSFQLVAEFIGRDGVDFILNPVVCTHLPNIHPVYGDTFMFNAAALDAGLGLEWWEYSDFGVLTAKVAENTLKWAHHTNAMASLWYSQLSALKCWSALLTVSTFNKRETGGQFAVSGVEWNEAKLANYSAELGKALEGVLTTIGPVGTGTNFTLSFITSQGQLILILVRWLSSLHKSSSQKTKICFTSTKLIGTVVGCLKILLETHAFQDRQIEELIKSFLGALLLLLKLVRPQEFRENGNIRSGQQSDQDTEGAFADVTLLGLGFLPSLCKAAEIIEFANSSIAVINILTTGFLDPSTWFPVLQNHFPLTKCLARMFEDPRGGDSKVMLNFCLSFVHLKGGAELLHSAGFFTQLRRFHYQVNEMAYSAGDMEGPSVVLGKHSRQYGELWSLGIAMVAGLMRSLVHRDSSGTVVQDAVAYMQMQKEHMVGALRAPLSNLDLPGKKKAKVPLPSTTLSALRETQYVIALMCEVSHHQAPWTLKDSTSNFGELVVHLLAFIAREGSTIRSGTGSGFSCEPVQRDEIVAHTRPAVINSNAAWFAITARGSSSGEHFSSVCALSPGPPQSLAMTPSRLASSLPPSHSLKHGFSGAVPATEYSNMVAICIYKISFLLLRYLCQKAHHATRRVEEGATPDYSLLPELPAPEILHGLQDQVIPIVIDICQKAVDQTAQQICLLLLSILEMTIYLEVFVAKIGGAGTLLIRSDDFNKDYRAMILAGSPHSFLEPSFQSLKIIMSLANPGLL